MQGYEDIKDENRLEWLDFVAEALLYVSICLIIIGVFLPAIFKPGFIVGWGQEMLSISDIFQGLWHNDEPILASIVFIFSVVFPILKTLLAAVAFRATPAVRRGLSRIVQATSKWSMLDVFLVAITIVFIKSFASYNLESRIGIYLFATGVILNNIVTMRLNYKD